MLSINSDLLIRLYLNTPLAAAILRRSRKPGSSGASTGESSSFRKTVNCFACRISGWVASLDNEILQVFFLAIQVVPHEKPVSHLLLPDRLTASCRPSFTIRVSNVSFSKLRTKAIVEPRLSIAPAIEVEETIFNEIKRSIGLR